MCCFPPFVYFVPHSHLSLLSLFLSTGQGSEPTAISIYDGEPALIGDLLGCGQLELVRFRRAEHIYGCNRG